VEDLVPELDQLRAEKVGREYAGYENDEQRKQSAEAGDVDAEPVLGLPAYWQQEQRLEMKRPGSRRAGRVSVRP
jgi:hypothetical protein